jgi:hypothetical protein
VPKAIIVLLVVGVAVVLGWSWFEGLAVGTRYHEWVRPQAAPKAVVQQLLSCLLLAVGLFVILSSRYQPADKNWAYGTIGALVGFWLK